MEEGSLREAAHIEPVHNNGGGSSPRLAVAAGAPPTFGGSCCPGPPSALCCACTRPCRHLPAPVFVTKQAGRLLHKLLGQTRPGGPGSRHSGAGTALELETASLPAGRWQWLLGNTCTAAGAAAVCSLTPANHMLASLWSFMPRYFSMQTPRK